MFTLLPKREEGLNSYHQGFLCTGKINTGISVHIFFIANDIASSTVGERGTVMCAVPLLGIPVETL